MGNIVRVLHVDDEPGMSEVTAQFLEQEDDRFEVVTATSAEEGLAHLSNGAPDIDCIVSDYDMPERDGLEFLDAVRETRPELPFILFTGKGSEEIASEAISRGISDYLQKESGTDQYKLLANRIANAVEQYHAHERVERLHEASRAFMRSEGREEVCEDAVRAATDILGFPLSAIWLYDEQTETLEPVAATEDANDIFDEIPTYRPGNSLSWKTFQSGETAFYRDVDEHPEVYDADTPVESEMILPLGDHGVMNVGATDERDISDIDRSLIELLASNVEAALDRARREAQHARSERRFRTLFEQSVDAIFLHTANGELVDVNERACESLGYDREELVGMQVWDIEQNATREELLELWGEMEPGETRHVDGIHRRADGTAFPVEVRVGQLDALDDGEFFAAARERS